MKKMQTIGTIMETFTNETANNIEELMKRGLNSMGEENLEWKHFRVYAKSANKMRIIIEKDISYLFALVASIKEMEDNSTVNISVVKTVDESCVCSYKVGDGEVLAIVYIKESYFKKLSSKKK